ncbi:MAG TPA: DUF4139 domain-containing protein [Kiloniellales bacterium]|jgi:hypothetical protein|nr:DUF4139 domain-containing protein [Kiloniellales bacterium]
MRLRATLLAAGILAVTTPLSAQERSVSLEAQDGLTLTLYQNDLGLVHDNRWVPLVQGENQLAIAGVSERLIGGSLSLDAGETKLQLLEQSMLPADLTPHELLRRAVGQRVRLVSTDEEGREVTEEAVLLSMVGGPVLEVGERIEINPPGRIVLLNLPQGLHAEPQLGVTLLAEEDGAQELAFTYLSSGLGWQPDYVARLSEEGDTLNLEAWATLQNDTEVPFQRADLRLVAGSVNREADGQPMRAMRMAAVAEAQSFAPAPPPPPESASDRYLFDTGRKVDLLPGEQKRLLLFSRQGVPVERTYRFDGLVSTHGQLRGPVNAALILEFENKGEEAGPLPAGTLRVYEPVNDRPSLFAGEARLSHTPVGGELSLRLGEAFDITATARQTAFERLSDESYEFAGEVTVRNAKDEEATVEVGGSLPAGSRILEESSPHEAESTQRPVWSLAVPAEGEATLTYRIRVNH